MTIRSRVASILILTLALPVEHLFAQSGGRTEIAVAKAGSPASGAEVALMAANMGKVSLATTDAQGNASFALSAANLGKVELQVVAEECPSKTRVWLVAPGGKLPAEEKGCRRKVAGTFLWGSRRLTVDVAAGTLLVRNEAPPARVVPKALSGGPDRKLVYGGLAVGGVLMLYGLAVQKKEEGVTDCDTQGASACSFNTVPFILGLAIVAASGYFLYKGTRHETALTAVPRGVGIRHTIRF